VLEHIHRPLRTLWNIQQSMRPGGCSSCTHRSDKTRIGPCTSCTRTW
jgi:hypothetical protein